MKKTLLILGAGYGGLMTAVKLEDASKHLDDVEIVLVDRNDYHQYVHLSYEIVTGVKKASDLTVPMSELLRKRRIRFVQAIVGEIDLANKTVKTDKGDMPYHELVIALGSEPNYFQTKGAEALSMHLSSVQDATKIQDKIKELFTQEKKPRIIVGGGGFTGVELAGEIADEFKCCVTIVEGSNILLPGWRIPEFSQKVAQVLTSMGATLVFNKLVAEVKSDAIVLNDGTRMACSLFIWTGGVQGSRIARKSGLKMGKGNRVIINEFCEAEGNAGVYVVGDCALVRDPKTGETLPQCVEIALQQAEAVSRNMLADVVGKPKTIFTPKFSGLIVAVGENYGIGRIFGVEVEGRLAQMVKRLIHMRYVYEIAGIREAFKESL
jgi:NADH dehydrogenase